MSIASTMAMQAFAFFVHARSTRVRFALKLSRNRFASRRSVGIAGTADRSVGFLAEFSGVPMSQPAKSHIAIQHEARLGQSSTTMNGITLKRQWICFVALCGSALWAWWNTLAEMANRWEH